ncbi:TRAP transporter substrate-binding protein [Faunimonas sp. B44]|uniref:TRAP transporter substrate-binding protein n=1 Tax=Faunimonas sp. B44 TaxID=3461493 RepID=UPI00404498BF
MIDRRKFLASGAALLAAPALMKATRARAAEVTLKLHHFLPPVSNVHKHFLAPWAEELKAASDGRIEIQIFPAMQLGGAPPQLFDQARDGVVDMVWTLAGYTPGRFPKLETFDLPFVAAKRGVVNAQAIQEFAEKSAADELGEVRPLVVWAQDHGVIHSKRPVETMADLKGLKLRSPTRLAAEALKALGATVVSMPVPQVPEALAQGVIDGAVVPWEVVPSVKIHELTGNHTQIPGTPTLYTTAFLVAMNKPKYEGLPDDLRAVLDEHSGQAAAKKAGQMFDDLNAEVIAMAEQRGNRILTLAEDEKAKWIEATKPVIDTWLADVKGKGIEGEALLEDARALVAKYDQAA